MAVGFGRRTDAQEKPARLKVHVGSRCAGVARTFATSATCNGYARSATQWASTTARTSSCSLFKTRSG
eukprot:7952026-Pyramimonas_sp.AAC.1